MAASRDGLERSLKTLQGCTVYEGHGHFVAEKKIAVNGSELAAEQIFLNVGARAVIPPISGLDGVPYLIVTGVVEDPQYLTGRFLMTEQFKHESGGSKWNPTPCKTPQPLAPFHPNGL